MYTSCLFFIDNIIMNFNLRIILHVCFIFIFIRVLICIVQRIDMDS